MTCEVNWPDSDFVNICVIWTLKLDARPYCDAQKEDAGDFCNWLRDLPGEDRTVKLSLIGSVSVYFKSLYISYFNSDFRVSPLQSFS